jgi:hypothetical protein
MVKPFFFFVSENNLPALAFDHPFLPALDNSKYWDKSQCGLRNAHENRDGWYVFHCVVRICTTLSVSPCYIYITYDASRVIFSSAFLSPSLSLLLFQCLIRGVGWYPTTDDFSYPLRFRTHESIVTKENITADMFVALLEGNHEISKINKAEESQGGFTHAQGLLDEPFQVGSCGAETKQTPKAPLESRVVFGHVRKATSNINEYNAHPFGKKNNLFVLFFSALYLSLTLMTHGPSPLNPMMGY